MNRRRSKTNTKQFKDVQDNGVKKVKYKRVKKLNAYASFIKLAENQERLNTIIEV